MVQVRVVDRLQQPLRLLEVADGRAVLVHALVRGAGIEKRLGLRVHVAQLDRLGARLQRCPKRFDRRSDHAMAAGDEEQQLQPVVARLRREQRQGLGQGGAGVTRVERAVEGGQVHHRPS